jgi:hypothetical protein
MRNGSAVTGAAAEVARWQQPQRSSQAVWPGWVAQATPAPQPFCRSQALGLAVAAGPEPQRVSMTSGVKSDRHQNRRSAAAVASVRAGSIG